MDDLSLDGFYEESQFNTNQVEQQFILGKITDRDKFIAAKQILLGLAILYILTVAAYLWRPERGDRLLDICNTTFPPLVTLILVAYFREKPG